MSVARAIGEGLECCADPVIWDEDVFEFGRGYLEELVAELERHYFALLVLTPDDVAESRGNSEKSPPRGSLPSADRTATATSGPAPEGQSLRKKGPRKGTS